ncbi:MAG: glycosyltransferase family 2 protein [Candidatus Hydrogenedentes bacterium]|nr:glycosyltransferase family 2 protein [Candidatus Hydrogenedentota bacterium]
MSDEATVDVSVVISCYFEEQSIDEFYTRLSKTLEAMGRPYEILFVNDGSTDKTFDRLKAIFDADPHVTAIVDFFSNAGQGNAKTPGVLLARGKAIALIDSDLQLDPEELPLLMEKFDEGYDIVSGYRKERRDSLLRVLPSLLANKIMRKASKSNLRDFGCTFKLYDRRLVQAFDFGPFKPWRPVPVIAMAGRIAEVPVSHHPRKYGKSGWTFRRLFAYNMENLVNLSDRPFQLIGGACLFLALLFVARIALARFLPRAFVPEATIGLALNAIAVTFLTLLAVLCAVGEFVVRSFGMLQARPAYAIREIHTR